MACPGLEDLRSTSIAGLNDIKCQFSYGTDYCAGASGSHQPHRRGRNLPAGVEPTLSPWSPTGEIVRYVLEGPGYTLNELKAAQDWVLNRALKTVPGVIDVTGYGGTVKQYQVLVDTRLMRQYGVTMQQVEDAIKQLQRQRGRRHLDPRAPRPTTSAPSGSWAGASTLSIRPTSAGPPRSRPRRLDDIEKVVVDTSATANPIFVRQVAQVRLGHRPRLGIVGRGERGRRRRGHRPDAEVREIAADRRGRRRKAGRRSSASDVLPKGMTHRRSSISGPTWSTSRRTTSCTT